MGRKIVDELGLADSVDTLGRWMAHYLAELIERADEIPTGEEGEPVRQACAETILRLWEHRAALPMKTPLSAVGEQLQLLTARQPRYFLGQVPPVAEWHQLIHALQDLHQRELRLCVKAWAVGLDLEQDRQYLQEFNELLSEEETRVVRILVDFHDGVPDGHNDSQQDEPLDLATMDEAQRRRHVRDGLARIGRERARLFETFSSRPEGGENDSYGPEISDG